LLVASGLGFFAFNLQDVLLEPYGGEILRMSVSQTTQLTAFMALGAMFAFCWPRTSCGGNMNRYGWRPRACWWGSWHLR